MFTKCIISQFHLGEFPLGKLGTYHEGPRNANNVCKDLIRILTHLSVCNLGMSCRFHPVRVSLNLSIYLEYKTTLIRHDDFMMDSPHKFLLKQEFG